MRAAALFGVVVLACVGCTDQSSTTPETEAAARRLSELSIFDLPDTADWSSAEAVITIQKVGGRNDSGPSFVRQTWVAESQDAAIDQLIELVVRAAAEDGFTELDCISASTDGVLVGSIDDEAGDGRDTSITLTETQDGLRVAARDEGFFCQPVG